MKFKIREHSVENLSEQDLITRTQFAYSVTDTEAIPIRWIADEEIKTAVVPSSIEGKPVKTVHFDLFGDVLTGIGNTPKEIVFSEGIQKIDAGVLFSINGVKKVVFPASVNYISPDVFSDENGKYRDLHLSREIVYVAPAGSYAEQFLKAYKPEHYDVKFLTVITDDSPEATAKSKLLSAFDIKQARNGVAAKFKGGYMNDFKEEDVAIPDNINGKPMEIFDIYGIPKSIKRLSFPSTITTIENMESDTLFYNSYDSGHGLEKIEIADENSAYWSDGCSIFTKDKKTLLRFMIYNAKKYTIPEGTETIGRFAFGEMKNLTELVLPTTIKKIDSHAFCACNALTDIHGMEYVAEVGNRIFAGEEDRYVGGTVPYEQNAPVIIVGSTLLKNNGLSQRIIKVPDGITTIGDSAFGWKNNNDRVEEIVLPASVKVIGKGAFCGRKQLRKVNIPNGVKKLPGNVFSGCEKMESIYIPASIEIIDVSAFPTRALQGGLCSLKAIEVNSDNRNYCSVGGMLLSKDRSELLFVPDAIQKSCFEVPEGVKIINTSLALGNTAINELTLPNSVTVIGNSAFSDCRNLEKIILSESIEEIGEYAFYNCTALKSVVWPKSLKRIGDNAFNGTRLEKIELPDTLEHIGSKAFANTAINRVTLPKSVRTLGWGAFSCVPEIEVYDSIDPEAGDASDGIDTSNGSPNSMVGYVGIGPARAMWDCAANHHWVNYTIVVRSAKTEEIKYKVWMGADDSQREYYCFLSSAWGHNATFDFERLDKFFPGIRGKDNKLQVAKYRLEYPYELADEAKAKYEAYMKKNF